MMIAAKKSGINGSWCQVFAPKKPERNYKLMTEVESKALMKIKKICMILCSTRLVELLINIDLGLENVGIELADRCKLRRMIMIRLK